MPTTSNFGWNTPADTDLVKDGALAIRTLGNNIDASMAELKGGTTGQVLSKTSNTDMDFTWVTSDDANAIQNAIVDAKGDLIAATANDTPARLAVGSNGDTLVADSAQSTGLRYNPPVGSLANPVINGGQDVWQRGTSFTPAGATLTYCSDRWMTYRASTGYTVTRQTTSDTTNLPNIQYSARLQRTNGNASGDAIYYNSSIETTNCLPFAGKTVTMSFYARAGANFSATSSLLSVQFYTGTGTDQNVNQGYTSSAVALNTAATLTTTWQRFAFSFTIGATITEFAPFFYYTPTGTAGANDWFEITGVQLDVGTWTASTAPTFRRSGGTIQGETALCQRYYYKTYNQSVAPATTNAYENTRVINFNGTTVTRFGVTWPLMRTAPSVTLYNPETGATASLRADNSTNQTLNGPFNIGDNGGFVDITPTGGQYGRFHMVASAEL